MAEVETVSTVTVDAPGRAAPAAETITPAIRRLTTRPGTDDEVDEFGISTAGTDIPGSKRQTSEPRPDDRQTGKRTPGEGAAADEAGAGGKTPEEKAAEVAAGVDPLKQVQDYYAELSGKKKPGGEADKAGARKPGTLPEAEAFTPITRDIETIGQDKLVAGLIELGMAEGNARQLVNTPTGAGKLAQEVGDLRKKQERAGRMEEILTPVFAINKDTGEIEGYDALAAFNVARQLLGDEGALKTMHAQDVTVCRLSYLKELEEKARHGGNGKAAGEGPGKLLRDLATRHAAAITQAATDAGWEATDPAKMTAADLRRLVQSLPELNDEYVQALTDERVAASQRTQQEQQQARQRAAQDQADVRRFDAQLGQLVPHYEDRLKPVIDTLEKELFDGGKAPSRLELRTLLYLAAEGKTKGDTIEELIPLIEERARQALLKQLQLPASVLTETAARSTGRREESETATAGGFNPTVDRD